MLPITVLARPHKAPCIARPEASASLAAEHAALSICVLASTVPRTPALHQEITHLRKASNGSVDCRIAADKPQLLMRIYSR